MSAPINTLVAYVPNLIARRLAADPSPITEPACESFPATVLSVGIIGLTTLAERLAKRKPIAAADLTHLLNDFVGQLIDLVNDHGGDIVRLDAAGLVALWPARVGLMPDLEEDLGISTLRAVQCGLVVQQKLGNDQYDLGAPYQVRVAVGTGQVSAFHLGGVYQRWEFVVTGKPLAQVARAERLAQSGEVVVSPEAWALVQADCSGHSLAQGNVRLQAVRNPLPPRPIVAAQLPAEAETALRIYIPGAVLACLAAGQSNPPLELQPVTSLVIDLPEVNSSTPLERVQMAMGALQEVLYLYEGSVHKLRIDDNATTLVAAMGLPPLAHDDDAARAVSAALSLKRTLARLHLNFALGITTGPVWCGSIGNDRRRDFVLIGATKDAAAQLARVDNLFSTSPAQAEISGNGFLLGQAGAKLPPDNEKKGRRVPVQDIRQGLLQAEGPRARRNSGGKIDGTILCDGATAEAASPQINFEALPEFDPDGPAESLSVFRPRGRPAVFNPNSPSGVGYEPDERALAQEPSSASSDQQATTGQMVGRGREMMELADHIQTLLRGTRSVVIIEGEAGIGKSCLVAAARHHAQAIGVACLIGSGDPFERATPYYAWRAIFRRLFDLEPTLAAKEVGHLPLGDRLPVEQIERILARIKDIDPTLVQIAPLLNAVLPLDLPDNRLTAQMTGTVRAHNTNELFLRLLQASAGESHKLLVIEDAHWLDSASWALLWLVSQEVQPVLLIVATRPLPQPVPTAYEQLSKAATTDLLQLKPLPANDAVALVCRLLGVSSLPKPVASLIEEKAKGHPLFSELLAFALRDSGCLEIINAECRLNEVDYGWQDLDFTDTLPQVVAKLISHLSPDQLKELEQASVIGHIFDRTTLAEVYPQNTGSPPPPDWLAGLDRSGLTSPVSSAPNRLFRFKHPLIREVVYGELNPHRRRELHQAVASWLERTQVDVLPFYYPLLAYHWSRVVDAGAAEANVIATATDYLAKAGQQALSYGANREAVEFFDRVLAVDRQSEANSDSLARARWERQLGEAYLALNQLAESRNHLERAVTLLGRPQPDSQLRLLTSLTEQVLVQTLHRLGSAKFDRRSPDAESAREVVRTYERLASIYLLTNDKRMLVNASLHALNLAENCGTPFDIARAYAESCVAAGAIPLHPVAEAYQRQALEKARALERCPSQAWVLEMSGRYGLGVGQWTQAEAALEEAAEIADSLKDQRRRGECLDLLGSMACYRGQFEHSATLFVEAYASLCQRGNAEHLQAALLGRAQSLLRLGQTEQAFTLLETVQQSPAESPGLPTEIWIYGLLSLVHLRRGDQLQAHRSARMGVQLIGHSPPNALYSLEAYADVAEVYLALWNANGGLSRAERSTLLKSVRDTCRALHNFARAFPIGQPRAWVFQGLYDWHVGQTGKAHKAWHKGLAQAERLEMPYEEGLAHYEIGRHLPFDDPQQEKHLTRACELFARLEARHDLKQARESLATRI